MPRCIERCCICLDPFELPDSKRRRPSTTATGATPTPAHAITVINTCGHVFHQQCWVEYVKTHIKARARAAFESVECVEHLNCPLCRGKVGSSVGGSAMTWIPRERKKPRPQQIVQARKALAMWRELETEIRRSELDRDMARTAKTLLEVIRRWAADEEAKLAVLVAEEQRQRLPSADSPVGPLCAEVSDEVVPLGDGVGAPTSLRRSVRHRRSQAAAALAADEERRQCLPCLPIASAGSLCAEVSAEVPGGLCGGAVATSSQRALPIRRGSPS